MSESDKKFIRKLAFIGMVIFTLFCGIFAHIQADYLEHARRYVEQQDQLAENQMQLAKEHEQKAIIQAAESRQAMNVVNNLKKELEACQKK